MDSARRSRTVFPKSMTQPIRPCTSTPADPKSDVPRPTIDLTHIASDSSSDDEDDNEDKEENRDAGQNSGQDADKEVQGAHNDKDREDEQGADQDEYLEECQHGDRGEGEASSLPSPTSRSESKMADTQLREVYNTAHNTFATAVVEGLTPEAASQEESLILLTEKFSTACTPVRGLHTIDAQWWVGLSPAEMRAGPLRDDHDLKRAEKDLRDKARRREQSERLPNGRLRTEKEVVAEGLRRQILGLPMSGVLKEDMVQEAMDELGVKEEDLELE